MGSWPTETGSPWSHKLVFFSCPRNRNLKNPNPGTNFSNPSPGPILSSVLSVTRAHSSSKQSCSHNAHRQPLLSRTQLDFLKNAGPTRGEVRLDQFLYATLTTTDDLLRPKRQHIDTKIQARSPNTTLSRHSDSISAPKALTSNTHKATNRSRPTLCIRASSLHTTQPPTKPETPLIVKRR